MEKGLQGCQKAMTVHTVTQQTFFRKNCYEDSLLGTIALFLIACILTGVFAVNGNKGDWGFEPKNYRYALIEG
ncbi:MAG: hypothetical protein DYG83_18075 [Candidatus Brocadia sp. AMX2]|uniref:Uncharacterized protein n=1 Tax=Candidatus Brocadia sinica JPN1 TaxID=1197129 RepID=A0ABQ0JYN2_9BACT|nr:MULTISPECIES: hypothetical protein [Brocadia]KXK27968.1 MAG: hypothetical protein UZ01_02882 [Candidatus Brocadia sinica]MBC6934129.1 hypothetical protein [Candidatus Brocadia sp.]MBL1170801.1 hypothetical protein [Candidatus Brocadia sp. AMX1]NOG40342.1 hypothetical protein [Planctomycetota bacterium]KAA0241242.1 MAG: hypothetical protein EDM70_18505 [Candidatus Brocadia sp. AMX2]